MNPEPTDPRNLAAQPPESNALAPDAPSDVVPPPTQAEQLRVQHFAFLARLAARKPYGTWGILAFIAIVFGLELLWGGAESVPVLARMGALAREKVAVGEWWRLMSSGVLHGGFAHVLMNAYVLFAVGNILERLLTTRRFLVLYVVSGLVAAVGSALLQGTLSVGASGAIWGLLGAEAAIAFGKSATVPHAFREQAKRGVVINLVINVLNSFRPHVDWAAHFAGGAAGLILTATVLLRGLPSADAETLPERRHDAWTVVAALLSALYFAGAAFGVVHGRAWQLREAPQYDERALPGTNASVLIPQLLEGPELEKKDPTRTTFRFGNEFGPLLIAITPIPLPGEVTAETLDAELAGLREMLAKVSKDEKISRQPRTRELAGRTVTDARYQYEKSGVSSDVLYVIESSRLWRVEVVIWPKHDEQYAGVPDRVVSSLKFR